jgi:catechol 2,3-dioxygenase-like lactoylglutathione lyase family enzyme
MAVKKKKKKKTGVRPQPLIAVRDVQRSAAWYAKLLGAENLGASMPSDHDHIYDRVVLGNKLLLQLHSWNDEHHPNLEDKDRSTPGHGVLVWFELDDFDAAVTRARKMKAKIVEDVHVNPGPRHRELWLRDPDGYVVVITSPDGEAIKATRPPSRSRRPSSR